MKIAKLSFPIFTISILLACNKPKIYVAGTFNTYDGTSVQNIMRLDWDGSLDKSFEVGQFSGTVMAVHLTKEHPRMLYIGGGYSSYDGASHNGIVRLFENGNIDSSFNSGIGFTNHFPTFPGDNDALISVLTPTEENMVYAGGSFAFYNGSPVKSILRLKEDGSRDLSFDVGTGFHAGDENALILSIATNENLVCVGGFFNRYKDIPVENFACLNHNGDLIFPQDGGGFSDPIEPAPAASVSSIIIQEENKVLVAGNFQKYRKNSSDPSSPSTGLAQIEGGQLLAISYPIDLRANTLNGLPYSGNHPGKVLKPFILGKQQGTDFYLVNAAVYSEKRYDGILSLTSTGSLNQGFSIFEVTNNGTPVTAWDKISGWPYSSRLYAALNDSSGKSYFNDMESPQVIRFTMSGERDLDFVFRELSGTNQIFALQSQ